MAVAYGIIAFISLCMVGACVLADKRRDVWLLLVFVSVSLCNLGYFMVSISKDLGAALNSNRIAYLGSVFLPFFLLMMVLRFCGIRRRRGLVVSLAALGVVMLAVTTSPGILPIYYSAVDIEIVNGTTKLVREYGPLHLAYYVYLIGYMLSMIGVTLYAIGKRKIRSRGHTVLLLCAVFCNITIWLVEQFLPRGFEWLSVSYIITECLMLAIYRSMQKQGMADPDEKKQTYTINVLLTVFLLLFANFVRVATEETTKAMYIISQVVVITIYIGILVSWAASVYDRIVSKTIRRYLITLVQEGNEDLVAKIAKDVVCITAKGKPIKAKTVGQQTYMKAIQSNTITIGVGPAGTGKTYLAVAAAVAAFRERTVNRIILTRPAVEAGERLGFLPGDLQNKVDPYLRPLYDALYDMLGPETFQKYQERGSIEVAPLAYMRGRTLDDSFIILDEAQNTTREQMKMFLTRLGFGSKIVITGDVTQIDLPDDKVSGLKDAVRVLEDVKDIAICRLTSADVVRHALVQQIINAYEKADKKPEIKKPTQNYKGNYQRKKEYGK